MGYQRKILHLTFEDKPGLEVYARSLSVGRALALMRDFGEIDVANVGALASLPAEKLEGIFEPFVKRVTSWTLEEDDGTPLPVTLEAFLDWDLGDAVAMFWAWLQNATSVTFPTAAPAQASGTTGARLEASIPMASPSGM